MNYYLALEQEIIGLKLEWMQKADHNIVFLRESGGEKNCQRLNGIRGVHQLRVSNTLDQECIMYRNITCACSACVHSSEELEQRSRRATGFGQQRSAGTEI